MTTIPSEQIMENMSRFAAEHIAPCYDLSERDDFPHDLWEEMAQAGLFKIGLDERDGGSGGEYLSLTEVADALVANGYNIGIAASWLYQQIVARFIIGGFGSEEQKHQLLPQMALGKLTVSFAVSEPKRGAHPNYLKTTAVKDGSFYTINGEKTFLTNGPIAGLFIVIAVTEEGDKKKFTAFLIPRHTAGLKVGPPLKFDFLKPSPHGSLVLNNCRLPDTTILGKEGKAYREMVIALGEIEDIVMMGAATGAMAAQLSLLISATGEGKIVSTKLLKDKMGEQDATLQTIRRIAYSASVGLDRGDAHSVAQAINFMNLAAEFQLNMDAIINECNLHTDKRYSYLRSDLTAVMVLKKKITQGRQAKRGRVGGC